MTNSHTQLPEEEADDYVDDIVRGNAICGGKLGGKLDNVLERKFKGDILKYSEGLSSTINEYLARDKKPSREGFQEALHVWADTQLSRPIVH
jgi:hypothetical protein